MRKLLAVMLLAALLLAVLVPTMAQNLPTVSELLSGGSVGEFTTLLSAVTLTDLGDTLDGEGPITVFAPTDEAIAAWLEESGMAPADLMSNPDMLTNVLLYHVVPGRYTFRNLVSGPTLETALEGESLEFALVDGLLTVNGISISALDKPTANGFVFVIDGVLIPPSAMDMSAQEPEATPEATEAPDEATPEPQPVVVERPSLLDLISNDDIANFSTLRAAVTAAGLDNVLSGDGPFTFFAPNDDAFAALLEQSQLTPEQLLENPNLARDILRYHIVPGRYQFRNLTAPATLATILEGQSVDTALSGGFLTVNDTATVVTIDRIASNGVMFIIDTVLLTPDQMTALAPTGAHVRLAHFSPDVGGVDVYVNDRLALENVEYGTISEWMDMRPGTYNFAVVPTGSEPSGGVLSSVAEGAWTLVAASGTVAQDSIRLNLLSEDYSAITENRARVSVFHAVEGGGAFDVFINGSLLIGALRYPGTLGDNDGFDIREIGAGTYDIEVRLAGRSEVIAERSDTLLASGSNYLLAIAGTPDRVMIILEQTPAS